MQSDNKNHIQHNPDTLDVAIKKAQKCILDLQYAHGYWWGELESNSTMEAEYLLLTYFMGAENDEKSQKLVNHIRSQQRKDGTWGQFYEAPGDLSTTTECYFALKMAGVSPDEPSMLMAKNFILSRGGVPETRVFTKIWLSLFGQWSWKDVPVMPAEIMLLPNWSPFNIYDFSSWARATIVPILILLDRKPIKEIPESAQIDELYPSPRNQTSYRMVRPKRLIGWETFFYAGNSVLRHLDKLPWKLTRNQAIKQAESWIIDHQESDGSWGGIQPPWVYSLMALHTLGYTIDHPVITNGLKGFDKFAVEDENTLRIQACISPLWDTALAMIALVDSGMRPNHPALSKSGHWLLGKQVLTGGDWQVKASDVPPGGWAFEFENALYPDLDDTAEIVIALRKINLPSEMKKRESIDRALHWLIGMQSSNGGWAAFDKNNTKSLISKIPFADFGEALDPPSVDVTAHVLEMMGHLGYTSGHAVVSKALDYILSEQENDGAWFGRWGVNYIYGTGAVLPALQAIGWDMHSNQVEQAVQWIIDHQNPDGGWGESCSSYVDPKWRGRGPSTSSQTAWALIALLASERSAHSATKRGTDYLIQTQKNDGSWDEPYFTGTGFPGYGIGQRLNRYLKPGDHKYQGIELPSGFMLNYHMYRNYWPLTALGRYRKAVEKENPSDIKSGIGDHNRQHVYQ